MRLILCILLIIGGAVARGADYVIAVSIDGMGSSYMQKLVDAGALPHFKQLESESAWTPNARNDFAVTVTLPNHTTMVTSRPITGSDGHGWTWNTDPRKGDTLHSNKAAYVASVFDVAHDHGKRTGVWATKTKFCLFDVSYDAAHGAPDRIGEDNGTDKLDEFCYAKSSSELTSAFLKTMAANPCHFALVHFGEGDAAGHSKGWGGEEYDKALITLDACLGLIMDFIATNPALKGRTDLIVTADHGGHDRNHAKADDPLIYTIPFFVWGADVTPADLYTLNAQTRRDPAAGHPDYAATPQPVRNGEVGNLALKLLGMGPIPGSTIGVRQDLAVSPPSTDPSK